MKRTRIIQLLACSLLLTACDKIEEPASSLPIDFSTTVDGVDTRFASDDLPGSLGIIASQTTGDFSTSAKLNFMYNQKLTRSGATWDYSPKKYWPLDASDKVSFFAYAPHDASGVTPCDKTHEGYPSLTFTAPTAGTDRVDLLAALPIMNKKEGAVNFKLKHALTRVSIYAKSGDATITDIQVHSTTVTAPKSGTLTFMQDGFGWTAAAATATFTLTDPADITVPTTGGQSVLLGTFYLIPDRAKSSFNLSYTLSGSIAGGSNPPTAPTTLTRQAFPNTYEWTAGASIAYTVDIKRTGIEITAVNTNMEWGNSTTEEINLYAPADLKIGDYYYDDGSWSDGGLIGIIPGSHVRVWNSSIPGPVLTNPKTNTSRKCIGVVFATDEDAIITDESVKAMVLSPKDEKYGQCYPGFTNTTSNFPPPGDVVSSSWDQPDEQTWRWIMKGDGNTATYLREILDAHLLKIENGVALNSQYWINPYTVYNVNRHVMTSAGTIIDINYLHQASFRGILKVLK